MKFKTKISLGLGFLFIIIFTLVIFCSYYIHKLSRESGNILKDNYDSIVYSKNLISSLDDIGTSISSTVFNPKGYKQQTDYYLQLFESGRNEFEKNLKAENNNITEIHEKEYVNALNKNYEILINICMRIKKGSNGSPIYFNEFLPASEKVRQSVNNIYDINMHAVVRKNQTAKHDSDTIIIYMAMIGALCIMLAFGYFWYFPFYISNSITYLTDKMLDLLKRIGIKIKIKTNDEAYIILEGIKLLENKFSAKDKEKK